MSVQFDQWWYIALAVTPVLLLIVAMGFLKLSGEISAVTTLVVTLFIAIVGFQFPLSDTFSAVLYGVLKAIFPILIIIVMALFSYNVLLHTQKMEVIKTQFTSLTSDKCLQVLLLTWGFGGLLEGMAGFGTAVAIPAAILISLGFKPIFSALVSLIANSVATGFGAVGTPVIALANQVNITGTGIQHLSEQVILQLSPLMFLIPFVLMFLTDSRIKALPKHALISAIVGGVSLAVQFMSARYMGAETPAVLGSIASILVIAFYARFTEKKLSANEHSEIPQSYSFAEITKAWSIYGAILILVIFTSPLLPFRVHLQNLASSTISLDILNNMTQMTTTQNIKIFWLTDAGVLLFLGSLIGGVIQGAKIGELLILLWQVFKKQYKTIITVCSLIAFSSVMDFTGMISTLGLTLAAATGTLYPLFAPTIGCLGTFLTGSDTSSNILFGKLQTTVAGEIGADPSWLAASNTAGATGGKIISPQSIAIATSACGLQGQEGTILKKALPFTLVYIVVTGLMVYFFAPAIT